MIKLIDRDGFVNLISGYISIRHNITFDVGLSVPCQNDLVYKQHINSLLVEIHLKRRNLDTDPHYNNKKTVNNL